MPRAGHFGFRDGRLRPVEQTWLVTGGAGFIGSNLVRHILKNEPGTRVVVLDKLTYAGHRKSLEDVESHPRFTFERGDIADAERVRAVFHEHRPTAILNLAAETHVDRSIDGPTPFVETNVLGTFVLLEAARALRVDSREDIRFLHVSTDEVYGSLGETGRFTEDTAYAPNSPYAASKASADHFVRAYHRTYGLRTVVTNCSNNYGPYQFPEKLVPLTILNAVEGKPLPIYGDGQNVRDWLHVEDHCAGIVRVLREGEDGEKYNIGAHCEKKNLDVVDSICAALEKLFPARENPALSARGAGSYSELKELVPDRPGHDRRYAIDGAKMAVKLGFRPGRDFDAGILETVRWYLDHREWCEAVQSEYRRQRLGLGAGERAR
jgi:dTDP-glucose 4,6-dehydratase